MTLRSVFARRVHARKLFTLRRFTLARVRRLPGTVLCGKSAQSQIAPAPDFPVADFSAELSPSLILPWSARIPIANVANLCLQPKTFFERG